MFKLPPPPSNREERKGERATIVVLLCGSSPIVTIKTTRRTITTINSRENISSTLANAIASRVQMIQWWGVAPLFYHQALDYNFCFLYFFHFFSGGLNLTEILFNKQKWEFVNLNYDAHFEIYINGHQKPWVAIHFVLFIKRKVMGGENVVYRIRYYI